MVPALHVSAHRVRLLHLLIPAVLTMGVLPSSASAQTTVALDTPGTEVNADTTIRGGGYAGVNYSISNILETKSSSASYTRRILFKFDTQNFVPAGSVITSATLSLVLNSASDSSQRPIGAFRITRTFQGSQTNWLDSTASVPWGRSGGDIGEKYTTSYVGNAVGSVYTFDLTSLVQRTVNGEFGSRYTRVALVDTGSVASYRSFYSSRAANAAVRPKLIVSYATPASSSVIPTPSSVPPPPTGGTIRVMQWNIHKGRNSNGTYDPTTDANWIVKFNPDVVSLNEVSYFLADSGREDTAARLQALLQEKTGSVWYKVFVNTWGGSWGAGPAILSKLPPTSTAVHRLSYERAIVRFGVMVNGREVNVFSTHVDYANASYRTTQINEAKAWASTFAEPRIVMGDFNTRPGTSDYNLMAGTYGDGWVLASRSGTATSYNGTGATHGTSRFDYVWSKGTGLAVQSVNVPDTRTNGVYASDHDPVVAVYTVQ